MDSKIPFNKNSQTKIPFSELVELIFQDCDYHFAIINSEVDEELIRIAKKKGIDLTGYKHVIETSGTRHSESRHGKESADRSPLSIEDYLLIPYIIKHRDSVKISNILYIKTIGNQYVYVEEIRVGRNKSLAFVSLYKRPIKKASQK